jgi:hypothetical protein
MTPEDVLKNCIKFEVKDFERIFIESGYKSSDSVISLEDAMSAIKEYMEYADNVALHCIQLATNLNYGSRCSLEYLQKAKDKMKK